MDGEEIRAIAGLVLIVAGVIVMIVPMVRATLGGAAIGRVPQELIGLTPQDQGALRRQVEENRVESTQDLPKLQATADGMVARRIGVWFCLGGAIAALGIGVSDPTAPIRLVFFVLILALTAFTARAIVTRAKAGAAFLESHPR